MPKGIEWSEETLVCVWPRSADPKAFPLTLGLTKSEIITYKAQEDGPVVPFFKISWESGTLLIRPGGTDNSKFLSTDNSKILLIILKKFGRIKRPIENTIDPTFAIPEIFNFSNPENSKPFMTEQMISLSEKGASENPF